MRSCPKCKSSDYANRSFQLMVNVCGHSLCKNCVDTLFAQASGPCPQCAKTLKKNGFWHQILDDPRLEREIHIRKEYAKTFNLREVNFPSLREYNDYLEWVEEIIRRLTEEEDMEKTLREIAEFEARWEGVLVMNRGRRTEDEAWVEKELEDERRYKERLRTYASADADEAAAAAAESKSAQASAAALIAELAESAEPAAFIVNNAQRAQREAKAAAASADAKAENRPNRPRAEPLAFQSHHSQAILPTSSGYAYAYAPPPIQLNGPAVHPPDHLQALGYLAHIRPASAAQVAGGYQASMGCSRALIDASSDLFLLA